MRLQISNRWFKSMKAAPKVEGSAYACHYYQSGVVTINISQPSVGKQPRLQIEMHPEDALMLAKQITHQAEIALGRVAMNGARITPTVAI